MNGSFRILGKIGQSKRDNFIVKGIVSRISLTGIIFGFAFGYFLNLYDVGMRKKQEFFKNIFYRHTIEDGFVCVITFLVLVLEGILLGIKDNKMFVVFILFEETAVFIVRNLFYSLPLP